MSNKQKQQQTFIAKLVGTAAALAAAFVAQQVINQAWKAKTGHKPPKPDDEDDSGLAELVAATAVTGAFIAVARVLATRGAANFTASRSHKGPDLDPTD
jgi:hypothetical protein